MKRFLDSDICRSALKLQSKRSTYFVWCFFGGDALRFNGAVGVRCVQRLYARGWGGLWMKRD